MIRTGYLRWEIDVADSRSAVDHQAREVSFRARPSYRNVRIKGRREEQAADRFARGEISYESVLKTRDREPEIVDIVVPDVGPHVFRYNEPDRQRMPRFWMEKLQREASAFAHEVVRAASRFPRLVLSSSVLRAGYARLVEQEVFRAIEGRAKTEPTREDEPMLVEIQHETTGVPELVAAELVRDVVEPREFDEFRHFDRVTIRNGDKIYRIPRRAHALIEVWDAATQRGLAQLCVVFEDPGMPPSDEVVMKYLLVKHQPDVLWQTAIRFSPPAGKLDGATYRQGRGY